MGDFGNIFILNLTGGNCVVLFSCCFIGIFLFEREMRKQIFIQHINQPMLTEYLSADSAFDPGAKLRSGEGRYAAGGAS